jgi:hypothetical protein
MRTSHKRSGAGVARRKKQSIRKKNDENRHRSVPAAPVAAAASVGGVAVLASVRSDVPADDVAASSISVT